MRKHLIFDLDGTVIDSSHRQLYCPITGNLNLEHWIQNSKPEKVMADKLLPIADHMKRAYERGHIVTICTARVMNSADWEYLEKHGLHFHYAMPRQQGDTRGDAEMKREKLINYALKHRVSLSNLTMVDDNPSINSMAKALGIRVFDAKKINKRYARMVSRG